MVGGVGLILLVVALLLWYRLSRKANLTTTGNYTHIYQSDCFFMIFFMFSVHLKEINIKFIDSTASLTENLVFEPKI